MAEAKRRFSELADRVARGETIVVARRGKPCLALVPPPLRPPGPPPVGLAAVAGELADWEDLEEDIAEVIATRRQAQDRLAPSFE